MKALQAYSQGYEAFRTYCLRYGKIVRDTKREDDTGSHRKYVVAIDGWNAHISMHNGVTISAALAN
jgi:hypothetical protein